MDRLTTDTPNGNFETLMNFAYARDREVWLRGADDGKDVELCEYISGWAKIRSREASVFSALPVLWQNNGGNMAKYHNIKSAGYDSRKEARRAQELRLLAAAGKITDLREQMRYELIPAQYDRGTPHEIQTGRAPRLKLLERKCEYVADFVYVDADTGKTVVEDAKGVRTKDYIIKRKLMLWVHGIRIREV